MRGSMSWVLAAVLVAGCGTVETPDVQDQTLPVTGGAVLAPDADLSAVPESSIDFWVENNWSNGQEQLNWVERVASPLFAGGKLTLRVVSARFPSCGMAGTVTASLRLSDGSVVDVALAEGDNQIRTGSTILPETSSLEVWLKSERSSCVEYDSRFGANYRFEVFTWKPSTVTFRKDATPAAVQPLLRGGALVIDYDVARLPNCRMVYRGYPNWFVKVWARFDTGETSSQNVVAFDYTMNGATLNTYKVNRAAFGIPRGAKSVQIWAENDQYPPTCHEWDSNGGQNYSFPVGDAPVCKDSEKWEASTVSYAFCPAYVPASQYDASACQFYVDGLGRGSFSHNGASASWLEAWLKVAPQSGTVVAAGMWTRFASGERLTYGVQTEPGTWRTGITTARSMMGNGAFELQVQAVAFFIDVQQASGAVDRVWLSRGGQNYSLADLYAVQGYVQSTGMGSVEWAAGGVSLFDQKRACGH